MSVRWYGISPGQNLEAVLEGVSANANSSQVIELNIDVSTSKVTDGSSTRAVTKQEVLVGLLILTEQIVRDTSGVLA